MKADDIRDCLNDYEYTSKSDLKQLKKLESLASLGEAVIKLFNADSSCVTVEKLLNDHDSESVYTCEITNTKQLLNWAKEN